MFNNEEIIALQQIARNRHAWTEVDRNDYVFWTRHKLGTNAHKAYEEFIKWSAERALYAKLSMKAMGVTDADQEYA